MDYVQIGFDNALTADYTAEQIRAMGYDDIHTLCGKNKSVIDEVFPWESIRTLVADAVENYIPPIEGEDGTIID